MAGFGFSAGLVDMVLSSRLPLANQPYMLIAQGIVFYFIYYFVFLFVITKFDLKTPGKEDEDDEVENVEIKGSDKYVYIAATIVESMGGVDNIKNVD